MHSEWLWVVFTLVAALAQTVRNSLQKELTTTLGTVGATHVRFLYGLPFSVVFLGLFIAWEGVVVPPTDATFLLWTSIGALMQVIATGMMLAAMRSRSFVVTIAYTKIEPVLVLMFAVIFLNEVPTWMATGGVLITTVGVMLMSWPKGGGADNKWIGAVALGLGSGASFAVSAVFYRGGILALPDGSFMLNAATTLVTALCIQTATITAYLMIFDRPVLRALLTSWRVSIPAGFFGALASQFWFLAFAIQSASLVRALALVEILFAQVVSRRLFKQLTSPRELAGIALLVIGLITILTSTI